MSSFTHQKLIERIVEADTLPEETGQYEDWVRAGKHIALLRENANEEELIVYAGGEYTFVHSLVVEEDRLTPVNQNDLLHWSSSPFVSCASYVMRAENEVWIERENSRGSSKTLDNAKNLVFARDNDLSHITRTTFEVLQEYAHLAEIHWQPERHAYSRLNELGDVEDIVSVTVSSQDKRDVNLVTFHRQALEQYLAAAKSVLVRVFDFTLWKKGDLTLRPNSEGEPEQVYMEDKDLFYRQGINVNGASFTRGVQIVRPARSRETILRSMTATRSSSLPDAPVDFLVWDWRNDVGSRPDNKMPRQIVYVSTDPSTTTNYFLAYQNELPYDTSPAFFRPEVLMRYKSDRDKYTIGTSHIRCRGGWSLKYAVNEANQVYAYICYLRHIPYLEQIYWKSFNEEPKASISARSFVNDFVGQPFDATEPLLAIQQTLNSWDERSSTWWNLRDKSLLYNVNVPLASSREEWAQSFMDLSKLVVEGFNITPIRAMMDTLGLRYSKTEQSLSLIEKVLTARGALEEGERLEGLREIQTIRSKGGLSHFSGREGVVLANSTLASYGTYSAHFESVCGKALMELELVEDAFTGFLPRDAS